MNCDFCKKRLRHPKIVHSAAGAFHPKCLDTLHAASEGFGKFLYAMIKWEKNGRPENMNEVADVLMTSAKPIANFLKQLAKNAEEK